MQPARLDLPVVQGATNRKPLLLMQPRYVYHPITAVQTTAPLLLTVPGHGLSSGWPVWIEEVSGWSALNVDKGRERPHFVEVIDADTLEINRLNGLRQRATGGTLVYQLPVDLAGCTGRLTMLGEDGQRLELTTANGGLEIAGPGRLMIVITAAQAAALTWRCGRYDLDLTMANGDVVRWVAGEVVVSREVPDA